jgi:methylenetetrahydrofolate dehydrogenase (NADP+)/methenyltetrahydrofolate cyclohydrolase
MKILDGKKTAARIKSELKPKIKKLKTRGITPALAVILAGENDASAVYVKNKQKNCEEVGIAFHLFQFKNKLSTRKITEKIKELNADPKIHGILVQLPLPKNLNVQEIISAISPEKDADCFHPENIGRLFLNREGLRPCTPAGIIRLLKEYDLKIAGQNITVIGRSHIVGKPLALILLNEGATVTVCHSQTRDLKSHCQKADIVISAVGKIGLIRKDMLKPKAVLIDVGINRGKDGRLKGDADFENLKNKIAAITPVPGGVGPMTIAALLENTVQAAQNSLKKKNREN